MLVNKNERKTTLGIREPLENRMISKTRVLRCSQFLSSGLVTGREGAGDSEKEEGQTLLGFFMLQSSCTFSGKCV